MRATRALLASPGLGDGARALVDGDAEAGGLRLAQGHDGDVGTIIAFHLLLEVGDPELKVLRVSVSAHQVEDDVGFVCALQEGLAPSSRTFWQLTFSWRVGPSHQSWTTRP